MSGQNLVKRSKSCLSNVLGHATELEIDHGKGLIFMLMMATSTLILVLELL